MKPILILLCLLLSLNSCYTIHFTKRSEQPPQNYEFTRWHHIGLAGLLEFSPPVNLKEICSEKETSWSSVRVQTGVIQGLVQGIFIPFPSPQSPLGYFPIDIGSFYTPEQVSVQCLDRVQVSKFL